MAKGERVPLRIYSLANARLTGSLDGDADRIVYSYWRTDASGAPEWRLLDGDKIAALFASFLCEELRLVAPQPSLSFALVQTAYANGAAGEYIRSLGVETRLAKTGVKHVHHVAIQYDVSVYFEANGHVRPNRGHTSTRPTHHIAAVVTYHVTAGATSASTPPLYPPPHLPRMATPTVARRRHAPRACNSVRDVPTSAA